MSSVVLARKYRPQAFADLVGQKAIARTLQNAVRRGRIHHAYLFAGTRGVGKTTTARLFAKALNCREGPTPEPCGRCDVCTEIAAGTCVDVLEIDAASHTKVEETRELLGRVAYAPAKGRYRVFIVDEVHMLSKSSFNALLKTLEEPPGHVVFILATTEPHKILETVRSRCIELHFRRIAPAAIVANLARVLEAEGIAYEPAALERIAIEAEGSMRDALSLTDQVLGYVEDGVDLAAVEAALGLVGGERVARLVAAILAGDPAEVVEHWRALQGGGLDLERLGAEVARLFKELILRRSLSKTAEEASPLVAILEAAAEDRSLSDLHRLFARWHKSLLELERSPVPDLWFETSLLRLATLEPLGTLEELLAAPGGESAVASGADRASAPVEGRSRARRTAPTSARTEGTQSIPPPADGPLLGAETELVAALLEELPALRPRLEGNARWADGVLTVRVPADRPFSRRYLEDRRAEIEAALQRLSGRQDAQLAIEMGPPLSEGARKRAEPPRPRYDKRQLLEDPRLRALLEALPGSEIVDVRLLT